jgi:hypothetical protein
MFKMLAAPTMTRPDGKDSGFADYYSKGDYSLKGQGAKPCWDLIDKDPFFVTSCFDQLIPGCINKDEALTEFSRCYAAPWSYDIQEITVPCFIYNGRKEETQVVMAETHHRLIKGSELTIWESYGHVTILMEFQNIVESLVRKEKAGPPKC